MPGRKLLVRGNHDFGKNGRPADTGSDATWVALVITGNPTLLVTHIAMNEVPDGTVNLYGHVHNNEPLREGPYVNICVEHTQYRPLPLDAVRRLALARLDDPAAAGGDDGRGKSVAWASSRPQAGRGGTGKTREQGLQRREFPAQDSVDGCQRS